MATAPAITASDCGELIDTATAAEFALFTITDTAALVVLCPEVSVATALRLCFAFVSPDVFHGCEKGAAANPAPMFAPSTWNWTLLMAALSDTVALIMTVPEIATPELGELLDTVSALPGWLFEVMRPEQPEIAALNSKRSGHVPRGILCESVSNNPSNFIIGTPGNPLLLLLLKFWRRGRLADFSPTLSKLQNQDLI